MTKENELVFYKNGSAESVLKRFVFSEKEEKLIRDAIRTANMTNPRMKLIKDADELLKEVAKTRDPIPLSDDEQTDSETKTKLENMKMGFTEVGRDSNQYAIKMKMLKRFTVAMIIFSLAFTTYLKIVNQNSGTKNYGQHSYEEARKICKKNNKTLLNLNQMNKRYASDDISLKIFYFLYNKQYWIESGDGRSMVYSIKDKESEPVIGSLYEVKCARHRYY